jgi:hypothetical protein
LFFVEQVREQNWMREVSDTSQDPGLDLSQHKYMQSFEDLSEADTLSMDVETLRYYVKQVLAKKEQQNNTKKPVRPPNVQMCSSGICSANNCDEDVGDDVVITKELLKNMLRRENELRLSEETQKKYMEAEKKSETDWMEVTIELQRQVVREFGIKDIDRGVHAIQSAFSRYGHEDKDFFEIPLYVRLNRARQGDLNEGEPAHDIPKLFHVDNPSKTCNLFDFMNPGRPLVVIAGSYT